MFQLPIADQFGWPRADFSLAIAIQNLARGLWPAEPVGIGAFSALIRLPIRTDRRAKPPRLQMA